MKMVAALLLLPPPMRSKPLTMKMLLDAPCCPSASGAAARWWPGALQRGAVGQLRRGDDESPGLPAARSCPAPWHSSQPTPDHGREQPAAQRRGGAAPRCTPRMKRRVIQPKPRLKGANSVRWLAVPGLEQQRAQRRRQRQRHHARQHHGHRDRDRELPVQLPGDAAQEGHRDEHRGTAPARCRSPRPAPRASPRWPRHRAHLLSRIRRSTFSSTTMASSTTMPIASTMANSVSVLIEKPSSVQPGEGADQRHRHRQHRDQRGAPGLQEHEDHRQHDQRGLEDGGSDLRIEALTNTVVS
jgi:hypothetical protein